MHAPRPNLPVFIGLALSLIVHVVVIVPVMMDSLLATGPTHVLQARFNPKDVTPPEDPDPEQTPLGIDADTPSTLTWIGYDEYQEHLAALAEQDQAAFDDEPVTALPSAGAVPPSAPQPEEPVLDPAEDVARTEPRTGDSALLDPSHLQVMRDVAITLGHVFHDPEPGRHTSAGDSDAPSEQSQTPSEEATPVESPDAEAKPSATPTPAPPDEPRPARPVSPDQPAPQQQADKESDPMSVIEAKPENWKLGKPLASPGLEIKTRKPTFTLLQRMRLIGRNPLCRIKFGPDGKPVNVTFIESSGSGEFDSAIGASLYRWRASGARLDELKEGQTADVVIRIVIHG